MRWVVMASPVITALLVIGMSMLLFREKKK